MRRTLRLPLARVDEVPSIRHSRSIILRAIRPRSPAGQRHTSALCQTSRYVGQPANTEQSRLCYSGNSAAPNMPQSEPWHSKLGAATRLLDRKSSVRPKKVCRQRNEQHTWPIGAMSPPSFWTADCGGRSASCQPHPSTPACQPRWPQLPIVISADAASVSCSLQLSRHIPDQDPDAEKLRMRTFAGLGVLLKPLVARE